MAAIVATACLSREPADLSGLDRSPARFRPLGAFVHRGEGAVAVPAKSAVRVTRAARDLPAAAWHQPQSARAADPAGLSVLAIRAGCCDRLAPTLSAAGAGSALVSGRTHAGIDGYSAGALLRTS